jgi:type VI secretion system protein VasD
MRRYSFLFLPFIVLQGCDGKLPLELPPPPSPPTIVNLEIGTSFDLNADSKGKGTPVMLRVYELREISSFNSSGFLTLFNYDQAVLGTDMGRKQELLLQPGEGRNLNLYPDDTMHYLGFFAAFRQLDTAQWRVVTIIQANITQTINVTLTNNRLVVNLAP